MFTNKGTYGHFGGILHAVIHGIGTFLVLFCLIPSLAGLIVLSLIDSVIHYHVDWGKMKINNRYSLTPASSWFWILLGIDQLLHQITYIFMISLILQINTVIL